LTVKKRRISVTVTESYLSAMDHLVEKGIYLSRGEIVTDGIRFIFERYRVTPFRDSKPQTLEERH
jgi:Arc/MetJ-type ribon-helix-helix transcriptional regulator